jgi:hypothetical protein
MVSLSVLDLNFIHAMYLKTGPLGVAVMLHGESLGFIRNPESIFRENNKRTNSFFIYVLIKGEKKPLLKKFEP